MGGRNGARAQFNARGALARDGNGVIESGPVDAHIRIGTARPNVDVVSLADLKAKA